MIYLYYIPLVALAFCLTMCVLHFVRLVKLGAPKDLSEASGSVSSGVIYSNTSAMLPMQKESAYKHLPTYTAGIIFHIGTFVAFFCFILSYFEVVLEFLFQNTWISLLVALCTGLGACCGIGLIIKRLTSKKLRPISNIDDYISVTLTTLFQLTIALLFTAFVFRDFFSSLPIEVMLTFCLVSSALLFIYLPFGKLRHVVYYFAARYHLGFFYGRRGTWPPRKREKK